MEEQKVVEEGGFPVEPEDLSGECIRFVGMRSF